MGPGSKIPHLSYVGDAVIGSGVNVGAGTITCNYDGISKHRTQIGDGAFIGSNTNLVAPVNIGPGAVTGAGSTITRDVPEGALAVERSRQAVVPGWRNRKRRRRREVILYAKKLKVFTGNANPALAQEITDYLGNRSGQHQGRALLRRGDQRQHRGECARGGHLPDPAHLPSGQRECHGAADHDGCPAPGLGAAHHRRPSLLRLRPPGPQAKARVPITAKLLANLITAGGASRVVTMDLHAGQIQGFFDIPVDHLPAVPILAEYFQNLDLGKMVVVSPDVGGVTRARDFANRLGASIAIIDKRRPAPNVSEIMNIIGEVEGRTAIIIDDLIDTAGTITQGAEALLEQGAKEVYACCTHPVFSQPAKERLESSPLKEVVVTNTIPMQPFSRVKVLTVAPLLGEAIIRIHEDLSVSKLFE